MAFAAVAPSGVEPPGSRPSSLQPAFSAEVRLGYVRVDGLTDELCHRNAALDRLSAQPPSLRARQRNLGPFHRCMIPPTDIMM